MLNSEIHFSEIPRVDIQRSRFDRSHSHKTAFDTGKLIPISCDPVLPGDTVTVDLSHVTRMTTPIAPVMDNAALDTYAFFVPYRLIWEHFKEFWGENNLTHWEQQTPYEEPQIVADATTGFEVGSLADYFGLPVGVPSISVSHLPFRAYCKVVNDWFRDENLKDPCYITMDETTLTNINYDASTYDYVTDTELGVLPYTVAKFHDYFTSCLVSPQKGPSVNLPLGSLAPVVTKTDLQDVTGYPGLKWAYTSDSSMISPASGQMLPVTIINGGDTSFGNTQNNAGTSPIVPTNLYADLSNATAGTINALRQAFAVQRFYEAQARGGSRYIEFVDNIFHVKSPDARQQRSEFLGAKRFPINVDQVLQTSATDVVSPQGNTAAYSCTIDVADLCTYSATEHGWLLVLGCVRTEHSYQQGIERFWSRKKWSDHYLPQFANLGEMPVLTKELYATGTSADETVFGYQEAWADYRYKPNHITGKLRSGVSGSLDIWHYADYYQSQPYLSGDWIDETKDNVARTLAVQNEPQFISDFYIRAVWTRPMPLYSVPGLLDHH